MNQHPWPLESPDRMPPKPAFEHASGRPTFGFCDRYVAWRRSKCRPVDRDDDASVKADLAQATLELVGEVAEAAWIVEQHGGAAFGYGPTRLDLIDELGDVLFCASWAGDAWGANPFERFDRPNDIHTPDGSTMATMLHLMIQGSVGPAKRREGVQAARDISRRAAIEVGFLANHAKKRIYQDRHRPEADIAKALDGVVFWASTLAIAADASAEDCLAKNIRKLDARFPLGFVEGSGGGDRTGEGA